MKFENVSCSQCGREFGPGDHGYSHCADHLASPVRYIPLINGTAFIGMGTNTGPNAGEAYPYVLWEDYDAQRLALRDRDQSALEHELAAEREQCVRDMSGWMDNGETLSQAICAMRLSASTLKQQLAEIRECPELNMNNYTDDDVRKLNDWAISVTLKGIWAWLDPAKTSSRVKEAVLQQLAEKQQENERLRAAPTPKRTR